MNTFMKSDNKNAMEAAQNRYLSFWTDGQIFAVPVIEVVQIVGMQEITAIPESAAYMKGIISLRGQVIPVIDIRLRLGKSSAPYTERTCIIITTVQEQHFGMIVDEVDEVTDIEQEQIAAPPQTGTNRTSDYLTGIAQLSGGAGKKDRILLLIDAKKILRAEEFAAMAAVAQQ